MGFDLGAGAFPGALKRFDEVAAPPDHVLAGDIVVHHYEDRHDFRHFEIWVEWAISELDASRRD